MISDEDIYKAYMTGWGHGATTRAKDAKLSEHENAALRRTYEQGYLDGYAARQLATEKATREYQYMPSILRTQEKPR